MVINYVANEHSSQQIRENTRMQATWELVSILDPDPLTGWKPNQADLTEVSERSSTISFSLEEWQGNPPKSLMELAEENLDNDLPLIGFVDSQLLRRGIRTGQGADHCVVICGVGEDGNGNEMAVIADPWFAALHEWDQDKLNEAWDPSHHQIIDVALTQTGKSGGPQ